jgi:hypothetical protein
VDPGSCNPPAGDAEWRASAFFRLPRGALASEGPTTVPFIGGGFLTEPTCQKTHVVCSDARAPIQNRRRYPGSSESRCAYEPQTTFPAFTVVLIFMAFSSCLRLLIPWMAVLVPIRTSPDTIQMPATLLKRRRELLPRFRGPFKAGSNADLTFLLGGPNVFACFSGFSQARTDRIICVEAAPATGPAVRADARLIIASTFRKDLSHEQGRDLIGQASMRFPSWILQSPPALSDPEGRRSVRSGTWKPQRCQRRSLKGTVLEHMIRSSRSSV